MKLSVEMPEILNCQVENCVYNKGKLCHARGITVGDAAGAHLCDTMLSSRKHTHRKDSAGVGACRATNCTHNDDFECQADGIIVGKPHGQAECLTFASR